MSAGLYQHAYVSSLMSAALCQHLFWAARYNTWLLMKLTPKGVVFSFLFLSTSVVLSQQLLEQLRELCGNYCPHRCTGVSTSMSDPIAPC